MNFFKKRVTKELSEEEMFRNRLYFPITTHIKFSIDLKSKRLLIASHDDQIGLKKIDYNFIETLSLLEEELHLFSKIRRQSVTKQKDGMEFVPSFESRGKVILKSLKRYKKLYVSIGVNYVIVTCESKSYGLFERIRGRKRQRIFVFPKRVVYHAVKTTIAEDLEIQVGKVCRFITSEN